MKWIAAILSAAFLVGCGVGVNDPEGLAAATGEVGSSQQGIRAASNSDLSASGPVSAPQDPIPAFEGHTSPVNVTAPLQPSSPVNPPPGTDPRPGR